jgi:hypothetical protein
VKSVVVVICIHQACRKGLIVNGWKMHDVQA